jgi:uncharacterized MnhB-related membrane protein
MTVKILKKPLVLTQKGVTMFTLVLVAGAVLCAVMAVRATRLLLAALWLAVVSALVAITLYTLGAPQVAVVELSVGAGLVTVLFVFAISVAGDAAMEPRTLIPRPLAWGLVILTVVLLGWLLYNGANRTAAPIAELPFANMFWEQRQLDVLAQIVLIFAGVLGVLGLLTDAVVSSAQAKAQAARSEPVQPGGEPSEPPTAEPVPEKEHVS